ncbi:hypothetical protein MLD38_013710 [Melastoma candidum]|uniref:Uncharacterized protein n=1 Tax=Melastoma candidum TaxID=119954 RepID=A0ACB9RBK7_9MYRT|nr:hypothetical protein MLD38_013710 [Melastoma candidum]
MGQLPCSLLPLLPVQLDQLPLLLPFLPPQFLHFLAQPPHYFPISKPQILPKQKPQKYSRNKNSSFCSSSIRCNTSTSHKPRIGLNPSRAPPIKKAQIFPHIFTLRRPSSSPPQKDPKLTTGFDSKLQQIGRGEG